MFKPNLNYRIGSNGHMYSRIKELKKCKNIELLFLGSSHAYRGFDTRFYKNRGIGAFNLGSSSQTPIQTLLLLKRYLDKLNPKIIVYDVYPETLASDGVESALDIIANDKNDMLSFKMALYINHLKVYNTFFYGLMQDIFKLNSSFNEPRIRGNDFYVAGGFVENKKSKTFTPQNFKKKSIDFNNKQIDSFKKIIKMIKQRNITLILVYAPIAPSLFKSYTNNQEFNSIMKGYSTYYNFNEILTLQDNLHFYDSHHLNQLGVEKFNEELIKIIKTL